MGQLSGEALNNIYHLLFSANFVFLRFSPEVSPVCLPEHGSHHHEGLQCVISGWGKTSRQLFALLSLFYF